MVNAGLHDRRAASRRIERLESSYADPWHYEPLGASGYEDACLHLLAPGLTPGANHEGLRLMYHRGGHRRQAAQVVAEAWKLAL